MLKIASCFVASLLALSVGAADRRPPVQPVGQLLNVKGGVEVRRQGDGPAKGVLLFPLQKGDVVSVAAGGAAELVLFEGGARYALASGSAAAVEKTGLSRKSGAEPRLLKRLPLPNPPSQKPSPKTLAIFVRGGDNRTRDVSYRLSPNGPSRAESLVLRWVAPAAASTLVLKISDEDKVVHEAKLSPSTRELAVPEGLLRVGDYYIWSLTALGSDEAVLGTAQAWVRILPPAEREMLSLLEQEAESARRSDPDNPSPLLLLGQAYERFGMLDEATSTYQRVRKLRPDDPGLEAVMQRLSAGG